jgi:putative membrane protein
MVNGINDGMGAGGWVLMSVFWVGLVEAIVWAAAALFSRVPHAGTAVGVLDPPEDVLDWRLASGEIDVDTYEVLRGKLRDSTGRV